MSGTKRSILFKNSSNGEVIYQKYSETKKITELAVLQAKQQTHPMELMQGETVIITTPERLLGIYVVEGEIGRKGRVVVETDEQLVTNLDHENSAEILETIGTC